jgi:hypothetical protein
LIGIPVLSFIEPRPIDNLSLSMPQRERPRTRADAQFFEKNAILSEMPLDVPYVTTYNRHTDNGAKQMTAILTWNLIWLSPFILLGVERGVTALLDRRAA